MPDIEKEMQEIEAALREIPEEFRGGACRETVRDLNTMKVAFDIMRAG